MVTVNWCKSSILKQKRFFCPQHPQLGSGDGFEGKRLDRFPSNPEFARYVIV